MAQKLVFLGGGSPFIPSTFQAIVENKEVLDGSEVCLMDLNPERLPQLRKLGEVLAQRAGMSLKVTTTTDARRALEGATFVFPGYRVGGVEALRQDFAIPTRHGICGDETAGPGGTFMAQCTIPATLSYCRLMEELCPDAWAISYVNPTNLVADAVRRVTKVKFIAVCDCFPGFAEGIAEWLEVPTSAVRARAMGVNHCTWLTELLVEGQDGYERFAKRMKEVKVPEDWREEESFAMRILDAYGLMMVCPGHAQMMWEHNATMEHRRARWENPDLDGWRSRLSKVWEFVDEMIAGAPYDRKRSHMEMHHPRHAIGLAVSIISNDGREWGGMNFPNRGAINNLPSEAIVEAHCVVDARGPSRIAMGDMPKPLLGVMQHIINWGELTVDAALTGDKKVLYQALLASPYVHDMRAAKEIMDELLVAHADLMPQFKK